MRSQALLDLFHCYSLLKAARTMAEAYPSADAQGALRLAEDDFATAAEELARMTPHLVPYQHLITFAPDLAKG